MVCCKLILLSPLFAIVFSQGLDPIVRVFHGVLQGVWKQSTNGRTYASFQGIPYARPPVGKYRFRHLKPWSGVWDASRFLSDCLQYDSLNGAVIGNEDCLFLNVYTPKLNPGESLPVVVFIHGGAFMFGSGALYDPCHLMDRDMVIVTMNYRLGPLGFLSTGDDAAPGNAGLKDQALALKWVRKNILMIGGNPGSVTLTGSSAGGASVHYHYLSPLSKALFDRGIAFSGSALAPWSYSVKAAAKAKALAAMVGCPTAISREMMDCLRTRPAQVIINAQIKMLALSDRLFVVSVSKMAQLHALKSGQPTYFYRYSYRGTYSLSNFMAHNDENYGTSHADDVLFIFKFFPFTDYSPEDIRMRDAMMDMIYSYASTGVPKVPNAPVWKEVKPDAKDLDYLDIVSPNKIGMKSSSDFGKKSFWDSLGFLEDQNFKVRDEL